MGKRLFTQAEEKRIRELHADGMSRNKIAVEMGMSAGRVSGICRTLDLRFNPTAKGLATQARSLEMKQRRLNAHEREMTILEYEQERILAFYRDKQPFRTILKGAGGAEYEANLDFIPPEQTRAMHQSRSAIILNLSKLTPIENEGANTVANMLSSLATKFGLADAGH